ncbi:putative metal-binding motif-containing protein [Corallococcus silvisoli]|uniref:putative metal-binding motif-containing protein n=1 Tax=Corallococcus silvisoli TaxID=2697031 RepID=UPI0013782BB8|nr:putative metal-binding motif-containing protein [Corallococcus silvisoli]NBD12594.1 hypothetical protein [Corallococcus silvisoli]
MKRLLLLLPLVALAGCKDPQDGVKVVVSYTQFVPDCVRVTARNGDSGETRSTDVTVRGTNTQDEGEVVVAVLVPDGWGPLLKVTADGLERSPQGEACTGKLVSTHTEGIVIQKGSASKGTAQQLALRLTAVDADGDGYVVRNPDGSGGSDCNDDPARGGKDINPNATEKCNAVDNNCNGVSGAEELRIGQSCSGDKGCSGKNVCNADATISCVLPDAYRYWRDQDNDGHGAKDVPFTYFCPEAAPLPTDGGYVLATATNRDDCDDTLNNVYPNAPEICDGRDNNCNGVTDEGFPNLGQHCTDEKQCADSTIQCNAFGNGTYCMSPDAGTWYPDEDNDSHGREDAGVVSCPQPDAGYILDAGDCDDGNPFIHRDATEICDGQDNNCTGGTDENNVCPAGSPTWAPQVVGTDTGRTWYGISVYGDGGVWIVGSNDGRAVKRPTTTGFDVLASTCTGTGSPFTFNGVWSNSAGKAFIGGSKKSLLIQEPESISCGPLGLPELGTGAGGNMTTTDLFGFASTSNPNDVQLFGVTLDGDDGATYNWTGEVVSVPVVKLNNTTFQGIHGISPAVMFAVGSFKNPANGNARAQIFRYMPQTSTWSGPVEPPGVKGLNAVWVVNPKLAYAVGDVGAFLKWDGNAWATAPSPSPTERLTGVIAFGWNSVYVASEAGKVYRYNDGQWNSTPSPGTALYGISGTRPDDIWAIGSFGNVYHYPAWPQ